MVWEGVWCGVGMGEHFFGNPLRGIIQTTKSGIITYLLSSFFPFSLVFCVHCMKFEQSFNSNLNTLWPSKAELLTCYM